MSSNIQSIIGSSIIGSSNIQSAARSSVQSTANGAPLTAAQQAALQKLHVAATQLESLFIGMLFKEMEASAPDTSIFGKVTESEKTWNEMLDQARSDELAKSGQLGIAKMIEAQLRNQVLASVAPAAGVKVKKKP